METKLPPEVAVTDLWPASVEIALPRRDLGPARILGFALLLFGLMLFGLAIYVLLSVVAHVPWVLGKSFRSFAFFLSVPTLGGLVPLWWGLAAVAGRRKLMIRGQWLRTVELCGPFWRSKRWQIAKIQSLDVVPLNNDRKSPPPAFLNRMNALLVRLTGGGQGMLAWGYADELLVQVAAALAETCNKALEREGAEGKIWAVGQEKEVLDDEDDVDDEGDEGDQVEDDEEDDELEQETARQPAGTDIEIEKVEGGLSIRVPAAGLWKGTSGLFFFSLLWNGFMAVFTTLGAFGIVNNNGAKEDGFWFMICFVGLFWLVGIGILLGALDMGWRKAGIAVADGTLMILRTGIFGSTQFEWAPGQIAAIRIGPSGMEVNDRPVNELQIHPAEGKKVGLLAGRSDAELSWLASELRQSLAVPQHAKA